MSTPWTVAFVVLALVQVLVTGILLGFLRRVTDVLDRSAAGRPAGPIAQLGGLQPGSLIPSFEMLGAEGAPVSSDDVFEQASVVVLLESDCDPCRALAADLVSSDDQIRGVRLIVVLNDVLAARSFPVPPTARVFFQRESAASSAFETTATPHAFVVSHRRVIARGIPNTRADLESLVRYATEGGDLQPTLSRTA